MAEAGPATGVPNGGAGKPPTPHPNAWLAGLKESARTLTWEHVKTAYRDAPQSACARKATLWACLVGGLMGLHRYKQSGAPRVLRSSAAAFMLTFTTQYYVCRMHEHDETLAMKEFMARHRGEVSSPDDYVSGSESDPLH